MMTGAIDAALEATLPLTVHDASGQEHEIEVVIDTGFDWFLRLRGVRLGKWLIFVDRAGTRGFNAGDPVFPRTVR